MNTSPRASGSVPSPQGRRSQGPTARAGGRRRQGLGGRHSDKDTLNQSKCRQVRKETSSTVRREQENRWEPRWPHVT